MKALSIEAIKQLKEDDWVYFILINENGKENECSYFQVSRVWEDCIRFYGTKEECEEKLKELRGGI